MMMMMIDDAVAREVLDMLARHVDGSRVDGTDLGVMVKDEDGATVGWLDCFCGCENLLFKDFSGLSCGKLLEELLDTASSGHDIEDDSGHVFMKANSSLEEMLVMKDLEVSRSLDAS